MERLVFTLPFLFLFLVIILLYFSTRGIIPQKMKKLGWEVNKKGEGVFFIDGKEVNVKYFPGSRNKRSELKIFSSGTFGADLIIRRETFWDGFFIKIGLSREFQTFDKELDEKFYFECEDHEFLKKLFSSPEAKAFVLDFFDKFTSIEITKNTCALKQSPTPYISSIDKEGVTEAAKKLLDFINYVPRYVECPHPEILSFKIWSFISYIIGYGSLILGFILLLWADTAFKVVDGPRALGSSLIICLLILLILTGIVYSQLKGFSISGRVFFTFLFCFSIGIISIVRCGGAVLNGLLDQSPIKTYETVVVQKYISRGKSISYCIVTEPWHGKEGNCNFNISGNTYAYVNPGTTRYEILTKAGKFGFEWIVRLKRIISSSSIAHHEQGLKYLNQGKFGQAIEEFSKSLAIDPTNTAYYYRGIAYTNKGELDQADDDFKEALKIYPNFYDAFFDLELNLGNIANKKGDFKEAIVHFTKIIETGPHNVGSKNYSQYQALAYFKRGVANDMGRLNKKAIDDYKKAIELNFNDVGVFYNLGLCYANENDFDQAITEYDQALKVNPKFGGVLKLVELF